MLCRGICFFVLYAIDDIMNEGSPTWMWSQIAKKRRCLSHKSYVRHVMADLQNDIARHAITTGTVDLEKRKLFLKYKNYYEKL